MERERERHFGTGLTDRFLIYDNSTSSRVCFMLINNTKERIFFFYLITVLFSLSDVTVFLHYCHHLFHQTSLSRSHTLECLVIVRSPVRLCRAFVVSIFLSDFFLSLSLTHSFYLFQYLSAKLVRLNVRLY